MTILYGIHNCDTVKKAKSWLEKNNINYKFHDLRKDGLNDSLLDSIVAKSSWDLLINKRSTTFRSLSDEVKNNLTADIAKQTVLEQPTLLKRPLLEINAQLHLGFKPAQYEEIFSHD
ncbi:ArsC family reductase [Thalassotalea psychrophila]|uniref:ArsC family reductase n=1 Tax=Thalassotalea psychrophila TaxID=3065647 RepID=A0ABY9TY83_9GAMM|nr:ArsC family reductase [Colwelliaceae bacterium SQ149]